MHDPQGAHGLDDEKIELIRVCATAGPGNRFHPVDGIPFSIFFDEGLVASVLDPLRDFIECIIPRNILPICSARPAHLRLQEPAIIEDILFERGALGTRRPSVGRVVRIAFHVNHLRGDVLRPVSDGVDDRPATYCTVRTCRPRFTGPRDFEDSEWSVGGLEIEPENSGCRSAYRGELQKVSAGSLHGTPWDRDKQTA